MWLSIDNNIHTNDSAIRPRTTKNAGEEIIYTLNLNDSSGELEKQYEYKLEYIH